MFNVTVADNVATVTLSRPPVNAINDEWIRSFMGKIDDLAARGHDHALP